MNPILNVFFRDVVIDENEMLEIARKCNRALVW